MSPAEEISAVVAKPRRPESVVGKEEGIKHGTPAGYKQHLYRKVPPCAQCLYALAAYQKTKQAKRKAAGQAPRRRSAKTTPTAESAPVEATSPWGVIHGDTAREPALTYIPYLDERGQNAARREQAEAVLRVAERATDAAEFRDLLDMLGVDLESLRDLLTGGPSEPR